MKSKHLDSICVHSGIDNYEFGPVVPPIYQTSTFKFESTEHGASLFKGEQKGHIYTRMSNPTIEAMENAVAALEGGHKALGCASGMAAIHTVFTSLLKAGDHVICSKAVYGPTVTLLRTVFSKFDIRTDFIDTTDLSEIEKHITDTTRVIYIESPANPTLDISDLEAISVIKDRIGAKLVVDNTFMSPALQQPLNFGVDIVLHSMTKFLNGHADVVAGIIVVKDEKTYQDMRKVLNQTGGVIDPFNSFLVHRGIKTLALRMEKHSQNAKILAEYLESSPYVKWVRYPGLKSHPQYETGKKQHRNDGGMIAFELRGGFKAGEIVMNNVHFFQLAVSLGGVESLIQHPASMTHFSMGPEARMEAGISEGLVRVSVGIENVEDMIEDIEQAFAKIEIPQKIIA